MAAKKKILLTGAAGFVGGILRSHWGTSYQLRLAEALGYRPELANCANCGDQLPPEAAWFSPGLGGSICRECGRQAAEDQEGEGAPDYLRARRISADSLRLLTTLQGLRTYTREAIPAAPPHRSDEVRALLRSFLEYHGGTSGRLRSLEFLDAMGVEARSV